MKKNGYILFRTVILYLMLIFAFGMGTYGGGLFIQNMKIENLITQCDVIDVALEGWGKNHNSIDISTVLYSEDEKIHFSRKRLYPENLEDLGVIQTMGYFSRSSIDLSQFTYITLDGGLSYVLEVQLPNGTTYKSPGSNK